MIGKSVCISEWESKGLSDESIKPRATSDNSIAPSLNYIGVIARIKFDSYRLIQDLKVTKYLYCLWGNVADRYIWCWFYSSKLFI